MLARSGFLLLAAALAIGCASAGISRDRAIEIAIRAASDSTLPPTVVTAEDGLLGALVDARSLPDLPRDRAVWAILLAGRFPGECVPSADGRSVCPPGAGRKLVVLDRATGDLLYAETR